MDSVNPVWAEGENVTGSDGWKPVPHLKNLQPQVFLATTVYCYIIP